MHGSLAFEGPFSFAAVVLTAEGTAQFLDLGYPDRGRIEKALQRYHHSLAGEMPAEVATETGDPPKLVRFKRERRAQHPLTEELTTANRTLYQTLVEPVIAALPADTRKVVIDPEGLLHLVPFAALFAERPDGGIEFFGERYQLSYISSPRDLVPRRDQQERPSLTRRCRFL